MVVAGLGAPLYCAMYAFEEYWLRSSPAEVNVSVEVSGNEVMRTDLKHR